METCTLNFSCSVLRDLVPYEQLKEREKHPWRIVSFSKVAGLACNFTKSNTSSMSIFHVFQIVQNGTKSRNASNIETQELPYWLFSLRMYSLKWRDLTKSQMFNNNVNFRGVCRTLSNIYGKVFLKIQPKAVRYCRKSYIIKGW